MSAYLNSHSSSKDAKQTGKKEKRLANKDARVVINGLQGAYYVSDDGYKYHASFPTEWAFKNKHSHTPGQCEICVDEGRVRGVFVKYCYDCESEFQGKRGVPTFMTINNSPEKYQEWMDTVPYLKGVCYRNIGDEDARTYRENHGIDASNFAQSFDDEYVIETNPEYECDEYLPY